MSSSTKFLVFRPKFICFSSFFLRKTTNPAQLTTVIVALLSIGREGTRTCGTGSNLWWWWACGAELKLQHQGLKGKAKLGRVCLPGCSAWCIFHCLSLALDQTCTALSGWVPSHICSHLENICVPTQGVGFFPLNWSWWIVLRLKILPPVSQDDNKLPKCQLYVLMHS